MSMTKATMKTWLTRIRRALGVAAAAKADRLTGGRCCPTYEPEASPERPWWLACEGLIEHYATPEEALAAAEQWQTLTIEALIELDDARLREGGAT